MTDHEIFWDGVWIRKVNGTYLPDPEFVEGADPQWPKWEARVEKFLRDAQDYWFHVYRPQIGDVIVDIGAGRGEDVFAFSRAVGQDGKVFAVEPHPTSLLAVRKLCEYNNLINVSIMPYACTDTPGDLQIETLPVWESNYVRGGQASPTSHPVQAIRFDDLAKEVGIGRIDFLKMNIEGAEISALPGCREALTRTHMVCISAHDFRANRGEGEQFRTLEFVRSFLEESGFRLITRDDDPRYYVPYHVHGVRSRT